MIFPTEIVSDMKIYLMQKLLFFFKDEEIPAYMTRISPSKKIQDTARVVRER